MWRGEGKVSFAILFNPKGKTFSEAQKDELAGLWRMEDVSCGLARWCRRFVFPLAATFRESFLFYYPLHYINGACTSGACKISSASPQIALFRGSSIYQLVSSGSFRKLNFLNLVDMLVASWIKIKCWFVHLFRRPLLIFSFMFQWFFY